METSESSVFYKTYLFQRRYNKIPKRWTYENFCQIMNEYKGRIYVDNTDMKNICYHVRYFPAYDYISSTTDINSYQHLSFMNLTKNNMIPCKDFSEYEKIGKENGAAVTCMIKKAEYSISYDYETDDEIEEYPSMQIPVDNLTYIDFCKA